MTPLTWPCAIIRCQLWYENKLQQTFFRPTGHVYRQLVVGLCRALYNDVGCSGVKPIHGLSEACGYLRLAKTRSTMQDRCLQCSVRCLQHVGSWHAAGVVHHQTTGAAVFRSAAPTQWSCPTPSTSRLPTCCAALSRATALVSDVWG